jgi:hypothetical protein
MPPTSLHRRQYLINDTGTDSINGVRTGAVVGFVCAGVFIILVLIWGCWRRSRRTQNRLQKSRPGYGYGSGTRLTKLPSNYSHHGPAVAAREGGMTVKGAKHHPLAEPGLSTPIPIGPGVAAWDVRDPGSYEYTCRLPLSTAEERTQNRMVNEAPVVRRPESVVTTATMLPPSYEEVLLSSSTWTGARRLSKVR